MQRNVRVILALLVLAGAAAAQDGDLFWIEKRAVEWAPRPSERKFDQIAWVTEARTAVELGKKHNRPVFIFTHDGRMARGRC